MSEWSSDTTAPNEGDEEISTRNSPTASRITHSAQSPESGALHSTYDEQEHRITSSSRQRLEPQQQTTASFSHYDVPIPAPVQLHSIFNTGGPAYVPYDYSRRAGPSNVNPLPWIPNELNHPPGHPPGHAPGHSIGQMLAPSVGKASMAASPGVMQQAATPASAIINPVPTIPYPNVLPNTSLPSNIVPFHPTHSQNSPLHHIVQPQVNEYRPYFDIPGELPWYNQGHLGIRAGIGLGTNVQSQNPPIPSSIIPPQNFGQASLDQLQSTSGAAHGPASKPKQKPRPRSKSSSSSPQASTAGPLKNVTRRSRLGCLTCRQRKKRCCESKPKCTECSRLRLNCVWPRPGTEHKNKPREIKEEEDTEQHEIYGKIKVLRGIVEYKSH